MSDKPDGGQAFPQFTQASGLTKRDYFAAAALPAIWTRMNTELEEGNINGTEFLKCVSRAAFEVADGMLREREQ